MTLPFRLTNLIIYIMYADDTTLIYTQPEINNVDQNVNSELQYLTGLKLIN